MTFLLAAAPMTDDAGRDQAKGRFKKGASGNPSGRPRGLRNVATRAAEALLDGQAEALTQTCVQAALAGDSTALRICMDRLLPPRRDRPVLFNLPPMTCAADACHAMSEIADGLADGSLTPSEATALAGLVDTYVRALETRDLEARVLSIEERLAS